MRVADGLLEAVHWEATVCFADLRGDGIDHRLAYRGDRAGRDTSATDAAATGGCTTGCVAAKK